MQERGNKAVDSLFFSLFIGRIELLYMPCYYNMKELCLATYYLIPCCEVLAFALLLPCFFAPYTSSLK